MATQSTKRKTPPKKYKRRKKGTPKSLPTLLLLLLVAVFGVLYYLDLLPFELPLPSGGETTAETTLPSPESTKNPDTTIAADQNAGGNLSTEVVSTADLSIHFLELGNKYTGDCTYIKVGDVDILIDAGSRVGSITTISAYLNQYVTDGVLEYVIVTHAHQDHYAGFATGKTTKSIFDLYECETIIDFAMTNQDPGAQMYSNYQRELQDEIANGATHYTAAECITSNRDSFALSETVTLTILDSYYYYNTSSDENNYSVCVLLSESLGEDSRHYLFTGDLEEEGEEHLVEMNDLPEVELFKAGHHGSPTSSNDCLLSVVRPKNVAVCCCCGSPEYTKNEANQFPSQAFIDRIAVYTRNVYVTTLCIDYENSRFTSMNGNIVFVSADTAFTVYCSGSTDPLYLSDWFKANRKCPDPWKVAS